MDCDLFVLAAEPSADLHGAKLIEALLRLSPHLRIAAMAGPRMRALPIEVVDRMENLQVMGFLDLLTSLPRIAKQFFSIRNRILARNPKAVVCIDYPGFNLRLERSLRKRGYRGKLIHYVCPTVWAWGKGRISLMEKNLNLLIALFPFEEKCFAHTSLPVAYVGHPLIREILTMRQGNRKHLLGLFPGSRSTEVERNFPVQLAVAKQLMREDPTLQVAVSAAHPDRERQIRQIASDFPLRIATLEDTYALMQECQLAFATSGTVTLELALFGTPTVVNFAIRPFDQFLARKIFRIHLPFYCIVNIIANRCVFPELFGPHLTEARLLTEARALWFHPAQRAACQKGCEEVRQILGEKDASREAAHRILEQAMVST